jgi:Domain of Unknown Function (DUF1080)
MRGFLGACLIGCVALYSTQPGTPGSNSLSRNEAAEGWLLLFDGESTIGWNANPANKLTVKDSALCIDGSASAQFATAFHEYALQFECRIIGAQFHEDVKLSFRGQTVKMAFPKEKNPAWKRGKLLVTGNRFKFSISGPPADFPVVDGELPESAASGLTFAVTDGVRLELRNVMLSPLGGKAIFNGKNLDGWKVFAGKKYVSKFTVNDKLEINVKNGPGDLQTEAKFGDFLLQLECFSNGKHLNSGVFFRCKEGEYQNGYECQIHNGWAESEKVVVVEHYDPKTYELTKEKVKTKAIDYGTGAIYRRIPARKQASKDGEWFTLTVAAHGNHFSTWVNGVQTVDWFDNRKSNANPRNGFRAEPGHISIQGHDPTTDLSFRNIRIAEYPGVKK